MILKGKKTNVWNKINSVEYINIPEHTDYSDFDKEVQKVIKDSKDIYGILVWVGIAGALFVLGKLITNYEDFMVNVIAYSITGVFFILLIFFGNKYSNKEQVPIMTLTSRGFDYKKESVRWSNIKNMYVKRQYDGDDNHYDLVVEFKRDYKETYSLDHLEMDYKEIIKEISKYYWLGTKDNAT